MRAKDYLLQIRKIDRMIANKIAEVEHWKEVAAGVGTYSDGDRVQSSGSKQKMADAVVRYVTIEAEINQSIDLLVDKKQEVIRTIEQLNEKEYDILHKVYVQGVNLQEVAAETDKSYSWVTSVHGRALSNLQRILNERNKYDSTKSKEKEAAKAEQTSENAISDSQNNQLSESGNHSQNAGNGLQLDR